MGVQHIDTAPSQAEHGLVVALALSALSTVVGARRRVPQAGACRRLVSYDIREVQPARLGPTGIWVVERVSQTSGE
jgi:hypothetical protein